MGYLPLDLHGNYIPMAHHCMLKEAHIIFYIQQANHEWIEGDEEETIYAQATKSLGWFLLTFNTDQRSYKGSKQPTSPWSKLCLVLKTWKTMANQLSEYFVN
jgi:hypothetical protein